MIDPHFGGIFANARVLVTGHTGFKGSWLVFWLLTLGARVTGYALEPDTAPSLFDDLDLGRKVDSRIGDIRDASALANVVAECRPEIVFHLAAQPLVRRSYLDPRYTFETNIMGTVNLLESLRRCSTARAVVNVTTDKVYANPETGKPFAEDEPLGGHDPYSASKAASEIVTSSYRASFFESAGSAAVATARAGNVIGGGDWAEDRIVPDIVRALADGRPVHVRNPSSVRPWQHVIEPLSGYLTLAAHLCRGGAAVDAVNFGPDPSDSRAVCDVVDRSIAAWGSGSWEIPEMGTQPHEAGQLRLAIDRARYQLGWEPCWGFDETIDRTIEWYRGYSAGAAAADLVSSDLDAYAASVDSLSTDVADGRNQ